MKKILLLAMVLFSSTVFGAKIDWSDLELYNEYKLTQNIVFENGITLSLGEIYELREIEPMSIPGYPMFYYSFHKKNCTAPDLTAGMIIIEVPGRDQDMLIGAQLEEGCNLGLYLEVKDYYTRSAFEE